MYIYIAKTIPSGALDDKTQKSIIIGMNQCYRLNLFILKRLGVDWEYIAALQGFLRLYFN